MPAQRASRSQLAASSAAVSVWSPCLYVLIVSSVIGAFFSALRPDLHVPRCSAVLPARSAQKIGNPSPGQKRERPGDGGRHDDDGQRRPGHAGAGTTDPAPAHGPEHDARRPRCGHRPRAVAGLDAGERSPRAQALAAGAGGRGARRPAVRAAAHRAADAAGGAGGRARARAARDRSSRRSGVSPVKVGRSLPADALEALVRLQAEIQRLLTENAATPEEARRANAELRARMRAQDNYFPELEEHARTLLAAIDHPGGPLSQRGDRGHRRPPGLRPALRARPAALHAVGHRPRARPHLPAAGQPRHERRPLTAPAGHREPRARPRRAARTTATSCASASRPTTWPPP